MDIAPRLIQLFSDARIGGLFGTPKPMLVLDAEGSVLLTNRASLTLLRARSVADAVATVAAEGSRIVAALRQLPDGEAQSHTLAFMIGGAPKLVEFSCVRVPLEDRDSAFLLEAREPVGGQPDAAEEAAALFGSERQGFAVLEGNGRRIYANAAASTLMSTADNLAEIIPGAQRSLASVREHGTAELTFGVLRIFLRRVGARGNSHVIAAFKAPGRSGEGVRAMHEEPATRAIEPETKPTREQPSPAANIPSVETPQKSDPPLEAEKTLPRTPSRFVWQIDAEGRFTSVSAELAAVVGHGPAAVAGMNWPEAAATIGIEGVHAVAAAVARRDTWSGVTVLWPVEDADLVRPVDLAALPVFDRERRFLGYRGFGVFREAQPRPKPRIQEKPLRSDEPVREPRRPAPSRAQPPVFVEKPENVVPLHKSTPNDDQPRPTLTPVERNAFREIAKVIGARMKRVDFGERRAEGLASPSPAPKAGAQSPRSTIEGERAVLDRLPLGVIVHRADRVLYVNRALLDWIGMASMQELTNAGGLDRFFAGGRGFPADDGDVAQSRSADVATSRSRWKRDCSRRPGRGHRAGLCSAPRRRRARRAAGGGGTGAARRGSHRARTARDSRHRDRRRVRSSTATARSARHQPLAEALFGFDAKRGGRPSLHHAVRSGKPARRGRLSRRTGRRTASPASSTTAAR